MNLTNKQFAEIKAFIEGGALTEQHAATSNAGAAVSQGEEHLKKLLAHTEALREIVRSIPHLSEVHGTGMMQTEDRHMHCSYCTNVLHRMSGDERNVEGHDPDCAYLRARRIMGDSLC